MNPFENLKLIAQDEQDKVLAECKTKMLELDEKSKKLDGFHKKQLYDWTCKNAALSSITELQNKM